MLQPRSSSHHPPGSSLLTMSWHLNRLPSAVLLLIPGPLLEHAPLDHPVCWIPMESPKNGAPVLHSTRWVSIPALSMLPVHGHLPEPPTLVHAISIPKAPQLQHEWLGIHGDVGPFSSETRIVSHLVVLG